MTVAAGLEIELTGAQAVPGFKATPMHAAAQGGAANFQSSWKSLLDSLGTDINTDAPQDPLPGPVQNSVPAAATEKNTPLPLYPSPTPDVSQISQTRVQPDAVTLLHREVASTATAPQESDFSETAHTATLENSQSTGKPLKYSGGTEKKPEPQALSAPQTATMLAAAVPVPQPVSTPPSRASSAATSQVSQSFLTEASSTAGHGSGIGLPISTPHASSMAAIPAAKATIPAAMTTIPAATATGIANSTSANVDSNVRAALPQDNTVAEVHTLANPVQAHSIEANAPVLPAAQQGLETASQLSVNTDAVSLANTNGFTGAAGTLSAASETAGAAHTLTSSDKRIGELSAPRATHGPAETAVSPQPGHTPAVQPIVASGETVLTRDAAAGHSAIDVAAGDSAAGKVSAAGAHETFAALDSGAAHGPAWVQAGAHSAEAGFEDPALGWVTVRADMSGGAVHASVVPGTADAAQALSTHMAGLNNYLNEQRTPVHTLTLASPGASSGFNPAAGQGNGQNSGSYNGANQQGNPWTAAQSSQPLSSTSVQSNRTTADTAPVAMRAGASISLIA